MSWIDGTLTTFDTESTGVDVERDRIVTAFIGRIVGSEVSRCQWLADPGVEIPEGATAVHGITTEKARAEGQPAGIVVADVVAKLAADLSAGIPVVTMNGVYDLTLLDREARRHKIPTLGEQLGTVAPIIDVRVLDKQFDRYRKGGRKLEDLCRHYQVRHDGAHDAAEDALAAGRILWRMVRQYPRLAELPLDELHSLQVEWAAEQTASFASYRRKIGMPLDCEDGTWPVRLWNGATQ